VITFVLVAFAIYAIARTSYFSLPTSIFAQALAILLPLLSYSTVLLSLRSSTKPRLKSAVTITLYLIPLLSAILATLSFADLRPESLQCFMRDHWQLLWSTRDGTTMQRIQDAFNCCGFGNTHDQAWPRRDPEHQTEHRCEIDTGRRTSCRTPWMDEERTALGLTATIGIVLLLCHAIISWINPPATTWTNQGTRSSWMPGSQRVIEETNSDGAVRGYLDEPGTNEAETQPGDEEEQLIATAPREN